MKRKNLGLFLVCLVALASAPIADVRAVAAPQIAENKDERALAALDKSVEYYGKNPSFSLVGRETTFVNGEVRRRTIFEFALQNTQRARLKISALDENGGVRTVAQRLLDADNYTVQLEEQPAQIQPVRTPREREAALLELIQSVPALGLSAGAMAMQTNPARTDAISNATFSTGANNTFIIDTSGQVGRESTVLNNQYTLDANSGEVRQLRATARLGNTEIVILTEFETPRSNWKGSQEATDDTVYNWNLVAAPDAETQDVGNPVFVDPAARATFERAAKLYRGLDGLHLGWKKIESGETGDETVTAALDYERDGRLRLQYPGLLSSLVVVDGTHKWTLQSELMNPGGPLRYKQVELADDDKAISATVSLMSSLYLPRALSGFLGLGGLHALNPAFVSATSRMEGFVSFEAKPLESQEWNGEPCDLVQILEENRTGDEPQKRDLTQSVYWFARSDGRLVRLQEGFRSGDDAGSTTDSQITEQIFNPKFAPDTFKFVPPKGAVLSKY